MRFLLASGEAAASGVWEADGLHRSDRPRAISVLHARLSSGAFRERRLLFSLSGAHNIGKASGPDIRIIRDKLLWISSDAKCDSLALVQYVCCLFRHVKK
ncbi:hypothetical protein [Oryzibacter oryziterrae]|uniref:hypothetical protein n=1 Tax=Oryzibacter oryziterrae TaxID=2766474 RepID=UPI001F227174|nr:hypothetical protein [Oryzibacter oryziterrae]